MAYVKKGRQPGPVITKVLNFLATNCNVPYYIIAERININPEIVAPIMKKLFDKGLVNRVKMSRVVIGRFGRHSDVLINRNTFYYSLSPNDNKTEINLIREGKKDRINVSINEVDTPESI